MASASVSSLIIFIASLVVAASVAGTLVTQVDEITSSVSQSGEDVEEDINTDILIISDTGRPASIYDDTSKTITVLVKNTGSKTLATDAGQVDVLVNGSYVPESDLSVTKADGNGGSWGSGEVAEIEIDSGLDSGDQRVTVIVNENEETMRFRTDSLL